MFISSLLDRIIPLQETKSQSTSFTNSSFALQTDKRNDNFIIRQDINITDKLTSQQKLHLHNLIQKIQLKCQKRHESIVLSLKKEVNNLVTLMLQDITREGIGVIDEINSNNHLQLPLQEIKGIPSIIKEPINDDNDSINSDPLGLIQITSSFFYFNFFFNLSLS